MNLFAVIRLLGLLLLALAALMAPSLLFALYYQDGSQRALLWSMAVTALCGALLYGAGRLRTEDLFRREATAVAGVGWILCALAGALPYWFYGCFDTFADCLFESMSGFTTTGASVITVTARLPCSIESLPEGLLFWRAFTHWLGGMGIVVLFVALLPFLGAGGRALFKSETPGPVKDGLTPRVKETAKILWGIYVVLTAVETVLLMALGMNLHEALCHAFATMATGGYSTRNASIAHYGSSLVHLVIIVFMFAAAANFSLYYRAIRGERGVFLRDREFRAYLLVVAAGTAFVAACLMLAGTYSHLGLCVRDALFQVVSILTTTGFVTADFNQWPPPVKIFLVTLMFIGGSAGSTGGGMKVIRCVILARIAGGALEKAYSPRMIRKPRVGNEPLPEDLQRATLVFFFIWMISFILGSIAIALIEPDLDMATSITAVAATINNVGPGLELVGATGHYAFFTPPAKILLSFFMVLGRLELYTVLVLFAPRFWRGR